MNWQAALSISAIIFVAAWMFRFDLELSGPRVYMLDRWTGDVCGFTPDDGWRVLEARRAPKSIPYTVLPPGVAPWDEEAWRVAPPAAYRILPPDIGPWEEAPTPTPTPTPGFRYLPPGVAPWDEEAEAPEAEAPRHAGFCAQ